MIIPKPVRLVPRVGRFVIPARLHLIAGRGAEAAADLLAGHLGPDRPRTAEGPAISLCLSESQTLGREGYRLEITPERVRLTASAEAGLLYGVQTLRQLLPPPALHPAATAAEDWSWPCLEILDAPRLPWRAVMLDVARHFMPLTFLYEVVDELALHRLNVLHLHLTDDQGWRVEIDGWPLLTDVGAWRAESMIGPAGSDVFDGVPHGGYYTQQELRGLVRFAAARGVMIVPEIEMPGHARAAIAAYPQLGNHPERPLPVWTSWGVSEDILAVHDRALDFCREVLTQVADVFPAPFIHIGGDECPTRQWHTSREARDRAAELKLAHPGLLHAWFLQRMHDHVAGLGRRAIAWDETGHSDGPLPPGLALTAWRDAAHGARSVARGHQVIMAPHTTTYLDYRQSDDPGEPAGPLGLTTMLADVYHFDPLAGGLPTADPYGSAAGVIGTQAQLWTEGAPTPDHVRRLAYPRLSAFAETAWSGAHRDYDDFLRRLGIHQERLRHLGVGRS